MSGLVTATGREIWYVRLLAQEADQWFTVCMSATEHASLFDMRQEQEMQIRKRCWWPAKQWRRCLCNI